MSFDYTRARATATRLIQRYGRSMSVPRTTGGTHDPVTGETSGGTDASITVTGVALDAREVFRSPADAQMIQSGDQAVYVEAGQVINQGETLRIDGEDWQIAELRPLSPAGTTVMYQALVRR